MDVAIAPPRIETDRVVLRRHRLDDAPAIVEAVNANIDHLRPWMPWAAEPATIESITVFLTASIEHFDSGSEFGYLLLDPSERHIVGGAGLHQRRCADTREIGYWVHVDWTRRGIATATARALTDLAFTLEGVTRVEIHCDAGNVASAGVPRALGWQLAAVIPRGPDAPGESGREMVWAIERTALSAR